MEAVLKSQMQLQELFLKRMDAFQTQLQEQSSSSGASTSVVVEFEAFRTFILTALKSLQDQVCLIAKETDGLEMRARRKILLLHGVVEDKNEDMVASVVDVVVKQLKVKNFSADHISRCHRMGRSAIPERPRPILLKLRDMSVRQKLWDSKTALKGTGVTLSEFLTKPRHDAFMAARLRFGITKCWTRDGAVIIIGIDGKRHRITSIVELDRIEAPAPLKSRKPVASKDTAVTQASKSKRIRPVQKT